MTNPDDADRDRAFRIAVTLLERTRTGELEWTPRPNREHAFDIDLPSGNVEIGTRDNDGAAPYDLRIFGPAPAYGLKVAVDSHDDDARAETIAQLWKLVSRATSGIDETLDGLLRDLGQ